MKFLHLADLHLGKLMHDLSLLPDQAFILDRILSIASREKPDAVLIAGDVYQRSAPQAEAMALFDRFVSGLAEKGIRVFIISGNHDSALRISYFSSLIRSSGVFVSEAFDGILRYVSMQDEYGSLLWLQVTIHERGDLGAVRSLDALRKRKRCRGQAIGCGSVWTR